MENTPWLLDLLKAEGVKATFFTIGQELDRYPEIARRILADGHEMGNHTYTHANLAHLESRDAIREEILKHRTAMMEHTGELARLFRAPYLAHNADSLTVIEELGLTPIDCNRLTHDWKPETPTEKIIRYATENIAFGDIIIMHDNQKGAMKAVPEVIRLIKEQGIRFVTVSELLELGEAKTY